MIPILTYHKVTNFDVSGTWVTPLQFEQQMRYLYKSGYTTVTVQEFRSSRGQGFKGSRVQGFKGSRVQEFKGSGVQGFEGSRVQEFKGSGVQGFEGSRVQEFRSSGVQEFKESRDQGSKQVLITFDDGYESFYQKALPILLKYGFRALIFVVTKYIGKENLWDVNFGHKERHLNLKELQELKRLGFVIGSHTRSHPDLTQIPINKAREEILNSKLELEDKLGEEVHFLSYPFGRYNNAIIKLSLESGYKLSFTSNPLVNGEGVRGRMGVYIIDGLADFKAKLQVHSPQSIVHSRYSVPYLIEARKCQVINFFSRGTWIWKKFHHEVTKAGRKETM